MKSFFKITQADSKPRILCDIGKCKFKDIFISAAKTSNLLRHIKVFHLEWAGNIICKFRAKRNASTLKNFAISRSKNDECFLINYTTTPDKISTNLLNLLVSGMPLSLFDHKSFKYLLDPLSNQILDKKVNSVNMKNLLYKISDLYKQKLKTILKGKLISIKLDGVSIRNEHFIGINIQIILKSNICVFNLGINYLKYSSTVKI